MKRLFVCWLLAIAALKSTRGATFVADYTNATNGVALTAGFIPDASRVIVGEPLFLTFVLSNRAEQPYQFSRVRNEIFTVTATNGDGKAVKSRYYGMDANGFVSQETVLPGASFTARIFLAGRLASLTPCDLSSAPIWHTHGRLKAKS